MKCGPEVVHNIKETVLNPYHRISRRSLPEPILRNQKQLQRSPKNDKSPKKLKITPKSPKKANDSDIKPKVAKTVTKKTVQKEPEPQSPVRRGRSEALVKTPVKVAKEAPKPPKPGISYICLKIIFIH